MCLPERVGSGEKTRSSPPLVFGFWFVSAMEPMITSSRLSFSVFAFYKISKLEMGGLVI